MKAITVITFVLGIVVATYCSTASAQLVNGAFETGDLTGWTATGTVQAVQWEYSRDFLGLLQAPLSGFWEPTEGSYFASLWSTDGSGTDTSTLTRTFTSGGGSLHFDYFYDFGDIIPFEDPARIYVTDSLGNSVLDMTINDPFAGTGLGDDQNIDWTTMSVNLPSAGTYTLGFEIMDSIGAFESILGVDNVRVVIGVAVDVKPGSYPNSINPEAGGVIPVAILTTDDFDASTVDPATVALEGVLAEGKGKSGKYGSLEDVDHDGDLDLVVQIPNTIDWADDATEATLTGMTWDGIPIQGTDSVRIVPPE
jgi:hypothetical protein